MHYFDYAAATPLSPTVRKAMEPYLADIFYNPSALYLAAGKAKDALENARQDVAGILGAKHSEIIFTAGATEADNLAIQGVMKLHLEGNAVVSAIEHEAVIAAAKMFNHRLAPVSSDGRIDLTQLKNLIDDKTVFVSVMQANNEIGTIQPLALISKLLNEIKAKRRKIGNKMPLYFHTDASQAPNYLHVLVNTLGVDLMSLNAGKIYGPKETGALYVKTGTQLEPLIKGGGQERGYRSGTPNVANIVGFAAALKEADAMRDKESCRLYELQKEAVSMLRKKLPEASVNGGLDARLPNNLHITIPGVDNERLMMELDEAGFMVAVGSACSASTDEPSHVLKAIGLSDRQAQSSLRITMGRKTSSGTISALITKLAELTG
jgi:cysteine desulfurase